MARNEHKETAMKAQLMIALGCLVALSAGCRNPGFVDPPNELPEAFARVVGPDGAPTPGMAMFPFSGSPVMVTLDGMGSIDKDGRITTYQWIAVDPMNPMNRISRRTNAATLTEPLGEGTWTFSLWVTDDKGKVSRPDTVTFIVGMPTPMGGAGGASGGAGGAGGGGSALTAEMCVAMTAAAVPMPCKTCICGMESCRSMVIESACDATCWALISCIGANCPTNPASCIATACGAQYAAYMAGPTPTGATAAGMCATACPNECGAM